MIAKISRNTSLFNVLEYNNNKVKQNTANIVLLHNMRENQSPYYTTKELWFSFMPYVVSNFKKHKEALHISMNPHPLDKASKQTYLKLITQYMQKMGYGNQPYVVFEHRDLPRLHYHIVSVALNEFGKVIVPQYDFFLSKKIIRLLEIEHGLRLTPLRKQNKQVSDFNVVDIAKGDLKSQLSGVLRTISTNYIYQDIQSYNALLALFCIKAKIVESTTITKTKGRGMVYFAVDQNQQIKSPAFKSSLFGVIASLPWVEKVFENSAHLLLQKHSEQRVKEHVNLGSLSSLKSKDFITSFKDIGISVVSLKNGSTPDVYFIDHFHRSVLPLENIQSQGLKQRLSTAFEWHNIHSSETVQHELAGLKILLKVGGSPALNKGLKIKNRL